MFFTKTDNLYNIARITGAQDNILGIEFMTDDDSNNKIEVIEWEFPHTYKRKMKTPREEVLKQVLEGLKIMNRRLGTKYKFSRIYFVPSDLPYNELYASLTIFLLKRYHKGDKFKNVTMSAKIVESEIFTINYKNYIS